MPVNFNVTNQLASPAIYASSFATRPPASFAGRIFVDTDNPSTGIYRDTGTSYILISSTSSGGTITGTGTTATLPIWSGSTGLGNSSLIEAATIISTTKSIQANALYLNNATLVNGVLYYNVADNRLTLANYNVGGKLNFEVNGGTYAMSIFSNGNLAINTTTDAGYKLDVNGTARLGALTGTSATFSLGVNMATSSGNVLIGTTTDAGYKLDVSGTGRFTESLYVLKSTNSGSASAFPSMQVKNTLATQGDGSSTFNFAGVYVSSGNDAVLMTLFTTYAAGTWAPAGIINVSTNHDLQIKTNNTTRLTIASTGNATFTDTIYSGATSVNASAQLQADSTTKGFLPPRMTTTQKNAIATPAAGLVIYDTTLNKLCVYTTAWETITSV